MASPADARAFRCSRADVARAVARRFACSASSAARRSFPSCWRRSSPWVIPRADRQGQLRDLRDRPYRLPELFQAASCSAFAPRCSRWKIRWSRVLHTLEPELVPRPRQTQPRSLLPSADLSQPHGLLGGGACSRAGKCIAVENFHSRLKLQLQDQVCSICEMRAYAAMAVVELKRGATRERDLRNCAR